MRVQPTDLARPPWTAKAVAQRSTSVTLHRMMAHAVLLDCWYEPLGSDQVVVGLVLAASHDSTQQRVNHARSWQFFGVYYAHPLQSSPRQILSERKRMANFMIPASGGRKELDINEFNVPVDTVPIALEQWGGDRRSTDK